MCAEQTNNGIEIKTTRELALLRHAGHIAAHVLNGTIKMVKPGLSTLDLEKKACEIMDRHRVRSAFLGYRGYPAHICISVNEEVVHGIPSSRKIIRDGDVVSIDVGIIADGFYGDNAATVIAGAAPRSPEEKLLVETTRAALYAGIREARSGNRLGDICSAIQKIAELRGFSVVRDFVGHGIGRKMHEEPQVPNYGVAGTGARLMPGMVLALEPMVNMGGSEVKVLSDGWTVTTADKKISAHFEHTVAITDAEPEILTATDSDVS